MRRLTIAALALACMVALSGCEPPQEPQEPKKTIKGDFTLMDIEGNVVRLKDFKGKVVLLEFWATWCPPCRLSAPELQELHERMEGEDFAIIAIAVEDKLQRVRKFIEEKGITYTVVMDDKGVDDAYGVYSIPTTILLDKEGNVAFTQKGFAPGMYDMLESDIRGLME